MCRIIGGGVGGLCLAQGLKQSGIDVWVSERDRSVQLRFRGYRIHLNAKGSHIIQSVCRITIFDPPLKEWFSWPLSQAVTTSPFLLSIEVDGFTLRGLLLAGFRLKTVSDSSDLLVRQLDDLLQ
jgi:heterodisulfide reductase subunit A-like polyferredoxin